LPHLRDESAKRVATSREFAWVQEDVQLYSKQKDKPVSLNEAKRLEEKKTNEDRANERKKARLALKDKPFEEGPDITLEILDGKPPVKKPEEAKKPEANDKDLKPPKLDKDGKPAEGGKED